jgi:uncharacterized membrane protein YcfT
MGVAGRLAGLDGVKGVSIVFVVMIHAAPSDSPLYSAHVIGGLTRLAVPCFLAITGFLAGMRGTGPARFRASFWTFVRLHLVYGVFYGLWGAAFVGLPDPVTAKFVVMRFGEAAWAGQYYFVVLIQLFLFLALLPAGRSWRAPAWLWGSAAAAGGWLLLLVAAPDIARAFSLPRFGERLLSTPSALPVWFLFFALGAHMGQRYAQAPTGTPAPAWCPGAVLLGVAVGTLALPSWPAWESGYPYARWPPCSSAPSSRAWAATRSASSR